MKQKAELRAEFLSKRGALSTCEVDDSSILIAQRVLGKWAEMDRFHVFLPRENGNEVNTWILIEALLARNKHVFTSFLVDLELQHTSISRETTYETGKWNIPQPVDAIETNIQGIIDVCIVPLLCVDRYGNRVGYGKGYYDDLFLSIPDAKKVGVSFFEPILEEIGDLRAGDVPLDYLVSPRGIIEFRVQD